MVSFCLAVARGPFYAWPHTTEANQTTKQCLALLGSFTTLNANIVTAWITQLSTEILDQNKKLQNQISASAQSNKWTTEFVFKIAKWRDRDIMCTLKHQHGAHIISHYIAPHITSSFHSSVSINDRKVHPKLCGVTVKFYLHWTNRHYACTHFSVVQTEGLHLTQFSN